jgi:hypothetical protein
MATRKEVSAITPDIWSEILQIPLYKTLVAMDVCNLEMRRELTVGDRINKSYFGDLSAQTYLPGTGFSAQTPDFTLEYIDIKTKEVVAIYVDDLEAIQANVSIGAELAEEMGYRLKDAIDTAALALITGGEIKAASAMDVNGTDHRALCATTANVINIFSLARKELRDNNVRENGDWIAILDNNVASLIEYKAANVGYSVADSTLRNGYAGDFMGFHIYISNNLPAGNPTADANVSAYVTAETGAVNYLYFGRQGAIDLVLQKAPSMEIKDRSGFLGKNFVTSTIWGQKVFHKNASRFLCVPVRNDV